MIFAADPAPWPPVETPAHGPRSVAQAFASPGGLLGRPDPRRRTHHLHLVPVGSARFEDELAFRELLRSDPATAGEYQALKRRLAVEFEHDRDGYTNAKAGFIAASLS